MNKLVDLLTNPVLRKAIFLASPEAGLIVEAAAALISTFAKSDNQREKELITLLDSRFTSLVRELSETQSPVAIRELEIRLHELLFILTRWDLK